MEREYVAKPGKRYLVGQALMESCGLDLIMTGQHQRLLLAVWKQDKMILSNEYGCFVCDGQASREAGKQGSNLPLIIMGCFPPSLLL